MLNTSTSTSGNTTMSKWKRRLSWLALPVMLLSFSIAQAQQLTATLSGIAADPSDARIPGASVQVINDQTGDVRETKADSSGFFSVTALIPGRYTVKISAPNFAAWEEHGILLNQGDSRTVANIHLKIGTEATAVTVISGADAEVPVDTAEVSATLNNELVDSATLTGRNAAELIKMMPGVTFNNSGGVGGYTSTTTGTNNGPAGSFSANGTQPYGSTDVYLDGANLIDPGNAGTQVANINQDMTDSVKYLSASYGAEYAKGPAVLQAFSKSGGQKFHGEGYLYARDSAAGFANDWNNKNQQLAGGKPNSIASSYFYYIGGNIGGPVYIPGLGFNKNKDKLFFWGGYENMIQHPYNAPVNMNVPTPDQLSGDFNNAGIPTEVYNPANDSGAYHNAYATPCQNGHGWQGCDSVNSPWATGGAAGSSLSNLSGYFDPDGLKVSQINPAANETPNGANGWSNYGFVPNTPTNRWEATGKVTYAFNENNKLWGSYAYQNETDDHPLSIWWEPAYAIPYPGKPQGKETANVYLVNFTHVFSATTTNETVFAYSKFVNANRLSDTSAVSRTALGVATTGIFGSTHQMNQIPDFFDSWAGAGSTDIRQFNFDGGIYGKNSFGKTAKAPSIADTFTKIIKSHSVKAGFYWDAQENLQAYSSWDGNGEFNVSPWGSNSTYNVVLDRLLGRQANYNESISQPVPDVLWHQWSIWAQDSWKATRKMTLNIGLRADHMGQWYDKLGGTQVWDDANYDNSPTAAANTGLAWHDINSKVPVSGWGSKLFQYNPRLGVAYDVFGNGRTVVRSGFGTYAYQVSQNDSGAAMNGPLGSFNFSTANKINSFYGYNVADGLVYNDQAHTTANQIQIAVPAALNQNGGNIVVDKWGDDKVPYANTYSLGLAQALPSHTVMEVSYVGSMSRNQLLNGTSNLYEINPVPVGAFFDPNPNPYSPYYGQVQNPSALNGGTSATPQDYRAKHNYGTIQLYQHGGYANYNSLQVSAQKQSGNLFLFTNFTFGKVLGTRDGSTANGNGNGNLVDPFKLYNNYGPLGYDHTKVFNLSFNYKLPRPIHDNWALGQAINGWELSSYTTYQDGSPYQANNRNMNANYSFNSAQPNIVMPSGQETQGISTSTWFGTNEYPGLLPLITCDPRKNLAKGQYFNPNCFAAPLPPTATSVGQQGPWVWPYIRTPHYFGSDLAVFKAFRVNDSQRIEARISVTNWLNHPNAAFGINGTADNQLSFFGYSTGSELVRNTTTTTTGFPAAKQGYRWIQFAAKYYF
jgi:hypothetical protein